MLAMPCTSATPIFAPSSPTMLLTCITSTKQNIDTAVRYKLWSPTVCQHFPYDFRKSSQAFVDINIYSWKGLPLDIVVYILNMLHPNWFSVGGSIQQLKKINSPRSPDNSLTQSSILTDLASWATTPVDEGNGGGHEQLVVVRVLRRWCSRCTIS